MWKDHNKWCCGSFMSSYTNIYRKWGQSWPKYRKSLTASIKQLSIGSYKSERNESSEEGILDDVDINELEDQNNSNIPSWLKICYLDKGYFKRPDFRETLYWCSIDLTKYYPSIKMDVLEEQIIKHCSITKDSSAARLISTLLDFKVNYENYSDDELEVMSLKEKNFHALPTGLIVGGWLANIYLLDLDKGIDQKLKSNNGIIHFRYVDDHTFVSDDFDNLLKWVHEYIVGLNTLDLSINDDKIQPAIPGINGFVFQEYLKNGREYIQSGVFRHRLLAKFKIDNTFDIQNSLNDIRKNTRIDPKYPSPLMTLTLQKVSQISHISLRLMSPNETDMIFHDLKSLISIDLPDAEIKKDTRISFASTMLSRLIVADAVDLKKIHIYRKTFIDSCNAAIQRRRQKNNKIERSKDSKNTDNGKELSDSEKYEKEIGNLCCAVFDGQYDSYESVATKENRENHKYLDWESLRKFYIECSNSNKAVNRRAIKVYMLLRQAIKEMPDKVNVWIRTMEFCIKHFPEKTYQLFDELWKITSNRYIHPLSASFICRQMISLLTIRMVNAIWKLNGEYDIKTREHISNLISIIESNPHDPNKDKAYGYFYNQGCVALFKLTKAFANAHIKKNYQDLRLFLSDNQSDANFYILWILRLAPNYIPRSEITDFIKNVIDYISIDGAYFDALVFKIIKEYGLAKIDVQDTLNRLTEKSKSELTIAVRNLIIDELNNASSG